MLQRQAEHACYFVTIHREPRLIPFEIVQLLLRREPFIPFVISRRQAGKIQAAIGPAWPEAAGEW